MPDRTPVSRSMASLALTVGAFIAIPIRVFKATEERSVAFRNMCACHNTPVAMPKRCRVTDAVLSDDSIVKGFEVAKDNYVPITQGEIDAIPLASSKAVNIASFVPAAAVTDPMLAKDTYYIAPDAVGKKAYAVIAQGLHATHRAGIAKVAFRGGREQLCAVISDGTMLRLVRLWWPDEVRDASQLDVTATISEAELTMAKTLIDAMSAEFDPDSLQDEYRQAVVALVEAKLAGHDAPKADLPAPVAPVIDLMGALRASVEAAQAGSKPRRKREAKSA